MEKTSKPTIAGILNIITGALELILAVCLFIGYAVITGAFDIPGGIGYIPEFVPGLVMGMAVISLVIAILILVGGIYALIRKVWGWALAGSILAILAFLPLGIAATVLTVQSKNEFE